MEGCASHNHLVSSFHERLVEDGDVKECVHDSPRIATLPSQWPSEPLLTHAALSRHLLYYLRLRASGSASVIPGLRWLQPPNAEEHVHRYSWPQPNAQQRDHTGSPRVHTIALCSERRRRPSRDFWPKICSGKGSQSLTLL